MKRPILLQVDDFRVELEVPEEDFALTSDEFYVRYVKPMLTAALHHFSQPWPSDPQKLIEYMAKRDGLVRRRQAEQSAMAGMCEKPST